MKKKDIIGITVLGIIIIVVLKSRRNIPKGAIAVKPFNLQKYLGKWFEIARLDYIFEKNLSNATAGYSLNPDGTVQVLNRGYNFKSGEWKQSTGKAKFAGDTTEAKLKVSFFGPFYAAYNIIAIDDDYKYAMVAGKNLDYLWLLSREKIIPENVKAAYLQLADDLGYNTAKLIWTEHDKQTLS